MMKNQKTIYASQLGIVGYLDLLLKETKKINPTLRNIATVAKIISENKYFETKSQLNKKLPKTIVSNI